MTRSALHQIAVVGGLIVMVSFVFSAPGVAAAAGGNVSPAELGSQSGQAQSGANTSQPNASDTNATVEFSNQTINGSTVTVERVTLPSSGFVVLDSTAPGQETVLEESTIAVSQRLSAGTHQNVTLHVNNSPPGGLSNRTTLNTTGTYETLLYQDSNDNGRFEYITSGQSRDGPFTVGAGASERLAADGARIIVRGSPGDPNATPTPAASVRFDDQRTNGSAVTVQSVTLPQGGFIIVHNQSYLRGGDPLQTAVGLSRYLAAGTHQNVTVALTNESVRQNQTLVAIPSRDTDNNGTYDHIRSDGFHDVPYTADGEVITDQAAITLVGDGSTPRSSSSPSSTQSSAPATTGTPATGEAASGSGGDSWFNMALLVVIALLAGLIVLPVVMRRLYG